jgi:hypothetical protein
MDKAIRNIIQRATQDARRLIEAEYAAQIEGVFDILPTGVIAPEPGTHLNAAERLVREKIVAAVHHEQAKTGSSKEAVAAYLREGAFTTLNRFVALKMLEARGLVQECVSKGEQSSGFKEFTGLAPGLAALSDHGYRQYIESLFDEIGREVKVLFDRSDSASLLWPRRQALFDLLDILNNPDLAGAWSEDETIGWVYQYFNSQEERKAMRDESQAPRNSRELAVRNQFFTPRYVVEFLTDNTLGRVWYEMRKGETALKEKCRYLVRWPNEVFMAPGEKTRLEADGTDLSQEELLKNPAYIEHRPKKDPRDIKVLDPACGSGHFLLYAFDLLETIYTEAWDDKQPPRSEVTGKSLREDFAEPDPLRRQVPRLIIQHNLHGIDIDPRAVQIATLALWLRAQKSWKEFGLKPAERPQVTRSHIVAAEPMPGNKDLLEDFAGSFKGEYRVVGELLRTIWEKMQLAGEAGSLLKIEEKLKEAIETAKEEWERIQAGGEKLTQIHMSKRIERPSRQIEMRAALQRVSRREFWDEVENLVLVALEEFAESISNGKSFQRRLFADDAAEGFAFIDLCRKRYDVVLMNPPFGSASLQSKNELEKFYPRTKNDLYAAFIERGLLFLNQRGLVGAITSRSGFFLASFQEWRQQILCQESMPIIIADLGYGVMDAAMVEAAAYCLEKSRGAGRETVFLRVLDDADKELSLHSVLFSPDSTQGRKRFEVDVRNFRAVPRSPFAYWASSSVLAMFDSLESFESSGRAARVGVATLDNFRFLRLFWEIPSRIREHNWLPYAKGGAYSPFYDDISLCVNWIDEGREVKKHVESKVGSASRKIQATEFYFRPGLTWPSRTQSGFAPRALPSGCIFDTKGNSAFVPGDSSEDILSFLALFLSRPFRQLVDLQMAFGSYEVGVIQRTPIPSMGPADRLILSTLAHRAWSLKYGVDTCSEASHAFVLPGMLQVTGDTLAKRASACHEHRLRVDSDLKSILAQIDTYCFDIYNFTDVDRGLLPEELRDNSCVANESSQEDRPDDMVDVEDGNKLADIISFTAELISWTIGVSLGRFDVRLATGAKSPPIQPGPFEQLPTTSHGTIQDPHVLPTEPADTPSIYPLRIFWDGILVDDSGFNGSQAHQEDIVSRVREVLELLWKDNAHEIEQEACDILGVADLREYFRKPSGFFQDHLKRYSKSRRKAPIYWQLATSSGSYSVWLYYHRFTKDTFYKILNDHVNPKHREEERRLTSLRQDSGPNPTAGQRNEIAALEGFVEELCAFRDEVSRIAPLWNPNLNDGVIINFAPLWRLVPQHRQWQRECKECWDKLVKGEYDWAHLAMHLWPERVVPKCAKDRSLAIAHGLEGFFWYEDKNGKWRPKSFCSEEMEGLIRERTSNTVRAALNDLVSAPAQTGLIGGASSGRVRRRATTQ